jgi:hypothetical protein
MVSLSAGSQGPLEFTIGFNLDWTRPGVGYVVSYVPNLPQTPAAFEASIARIVSQSTPTDPMPDEEALRTPFTHLCGAVGIIDDVNQSSEIVQQTPDMEVEILQGLAK